MTAWTDKHRKFASWWALRMAARLVLEGEGDAYQITMLVGIGRDPGWYAANMRNRLREVGLGHLADQATWLIDDLAAGRVQPTDVVV